MQSFTVYVTTVNAKDGTVDELPPKQMEHVNCYSLLGKLATSMHEHIDHRRCELHSVRIEPVAPNEQSE